ncbi:MULTISPECIES: fimbrial protein [Rahnella]|jgi:major type 1 subunit fimbrin (pilin)|uniref:Fimbrial protein n=1 Tax=Rahnella sp. (strain Y9602) TaxID=2703885 RepID=A0A0H3FDT4_RAHSY|nr:MULTISPECIES: fimbrial protein [Rahnella]AFE60154.1 fimbrial protein domain-containing protein [Rahnella aquatilis HX2]AYA08757.1 type 1 fimbrial protein [Rahnella aquatilis]ADW75464.1 Fimbrial protein domain-containing protein [Rahnella aceris]AZP43934.1 type 1 fimbrial protein [Rahnella aquatilis]AZP48271.1 type 1 fimbrial protein [Rahnella aquatilis]
MKMKMVSAAVFVFAALSSQAAFAIDGTLNFTGTVKSTACSLESKDLTVTIEKVAASTLNALAVGETTPGASEPFSLVLRGCPASVTSANVKFKGNSSTSNQFTDATPSAVGTIIKAADGTLQVPNTDMPAALVEGDNTLNYVAALTRTKTSNVGTGSWTLNLPFEITYQ